MNKKDKHIKPGYHLTEVGIIPMDWELKTYGEIFSFLNTAQYSRDELSENWGVLYLHYWDIHVKFSNKLDVWNATLPTISETQLKKYSLVKDWDLIMADASEDYNWIWKSIEVFWLGKKKLISGLHTFLMRDNQWKLVNGFRGYLHENNTIKTQFDRLATWLKVYGVSKNNLKKVIIPVPNKSEQSAIAQALYDTDTLICSLDELIEKKKSIKQGTMQELLTGKRRLPWFENKWSNIAIWDFWFCYWWLTWKSKKDFGSGNARYIPFLNIMRWPVIDINYFDSVNLNVGESQNKAQMYDLFFNWSSETPEELWMCSVLLEDIPDLYLNSFCFWFRIKNLKEIDWLFLSYFFRSNQGRKVIFSLAQWATRYNLSKTAFLKSEISIPDFAEQIAISEIIKNMDSEISELEKKRDKYKQIKQGMMSELLTGNIRLLWVK